MWNSASAILKCAVELTGRNSVSPSIIPSTTESRESFKFPPYDVLRKYRRNYSADGWHFWFGDRNQNPALIQSCFRRSEYSAESDRGAVAHALPSLSAEIGSPLSVRSQRLCSWIPQISWLRFPSCKFRSKPTSATPHRTAPPLPLETAGARWHTSHKSRLLWWDTWRRLANRHKVYCRSSERLPDRPTLSPEIS